MTYISWLDYTARRLVRQLEDLFLRWLFVYIAVKMNTFVYFELFGLLAMIHDAVTL